VLLPEAPQSEGRDAAYDADRSAHGYVWNLSRLWGWRPDVFTGFADLRNTLMDGSTLSASEFAVLVNATASSLGDSYCCIAWGLKLAKTHGADAAAGVISGDDAGLNEREAALSRWARAVVRDANGTTEADVQELRDAGFDDREIFEATAWIGFRIALSTVNDALGCGPDADLVAGTPAPIRDAVAFGRPAS
jgi:alkylhydroperoxidase family enzyme